MAELLIFAMMTISAIIGMAVVAAGMWVFYRRQGGKMSLAEWMREF